MAEANTNAIPASETPLVDPTSLQQGGLENLFQEAHDAIPVTTPGMRVYTRRARATTSTLVPEMEDEGTMKNANNATAQEVHDDSNDLGAHVRVSRTEDEVETVIHRNYISDDDANARSDGPTPGARRTHNHPSMSKLEEQIKQLNQSMAQMAQMMMEKDRQISILLQKSGSKDDIGVSN
ncbi:hypothetical protein QJS04_geneDACA023495 [Acorus gramineus]|uniref:Uncharacterized protein n=1 Tax=Acorus gramineus TaxID=55184 RepID=A0AAV9B2A6_ACOGR|nr:hypothetical protein QJS04_geneDACA023495 [Acorus gramineus]